MNIRRKPSPYEAQQIAAYFEQRSKKEIKVCKSLNVIFTISGLFFFGGLTVTLENLALRIILGAVSFLIVFWATFNTKNVKSEILAYKNCEYEIADATVINAKRNPDAVDRYYIWVKTDSDGEEFNGLEVFDDGGVEVGDKVILVIPLSPNIRKGIVSAFTQAMLSETFIYR